VEIELDGVERLRFADGAPVRAASGVAPFGDGFVVVQDDATHAAWFSGQSVTAVRLVPGVDGLEVFDEASGTKHLKPDMEAACQLLIDGEPGLLVLGSGSAAERMRWSLLRLERGRPDAVVADMSPLYCVVADALDVELDALNLEGACVVGGSLRWFHRGLPAAGLRSGSVDLELAETLAAVLGRADPASVPVTNTRHYDFGEVDGIGLAATDAVALPGGAILVSAAAEDSPNARDDGPVVGSALVLLDGHRVQDVSPVPPVAGAVSKVEGLMVVDAGSTQARLLAVVDVDDPEAPSLALRLRARW
jgi:hypothetical protein